MRDAKKSDLPALKALWQVCFHDPAELIDGFFETVGDTVRVFTDEACDCMTVSVPCRWQGKRAAYLYAVCTAPEARGRGLCTALLRHAERQAAADGCSYALLCPAEPSLFDFYGARGYQTALFGTVVRVSADAEADGDAIPVTPERYAALRTQKAADAVVFPLPLLTWQAKLGMLLELPHGCAAAERVDSGWVCRELLSDAPEADGAAVCKLLGLSELEAVLPGGRPQAMVKPLDGSPVGTGFLGLMF